MTLLARLGGGSGEVMVFDFLSPPTKVFRAASDKERAALEDLAARLEKLHGGTEYAVKFAAFDGESHASVQPAALSRGMHFAFDQ